MDGISDQGIASWDGNFAESYFVSYFNRQWIHEGHIKNARYVVQWNVMTESSKGPNPHGDYREQFEAWYQDASSLGLTIDVGLTSYAGAPPETSSQYSEALSALLAAFPGIRNVEAWNEPNNSPYLTPVAAAHFANAAYSLCEAKKTCTVVVGDFLDSPNEVSYEKEYEKYLSPSNPPNWGLHPYYAVKEQNEAPVYEFQKHLPSEGAGDEIWYTEIGAYNCVDYGGKLEQIGEERQEDDAYWLTHLLMVNEKALHVFYYEFLNGNHEPPPCTPTQADTALYVPSSDPNAPDRPRGAASYIDNNTGVPWAYTGAATSVGASKATLTGSVYHNGRNVSEAYFEYGTTPSYGATTSHTTFPLEYAGSAANIEATGLQPETTYHYRLVAVNYEGSRVGEDKTFTTPGSTLLQTPNPGPASASDNLASVSCSRPGACIAAGTESEGAGKYTAFGAGWNGTAWSSQTIPTYEGHPDFINAVSCWSATECMAVGIYEEAGADSKSFAESWNGTAWSATTPVPLPSGANGNQLRGISCTSANFCIATGLYWKKAKYIGYATEWNGKSWTTIDPPLTESKFSDLNDVSCTSTSFCMAVGIFQYKGSKEYPLVEEWNGKEWKTEAPSGEEGEMRGVSCASAQACTAVGPLHILHWNGSEWTAQTPASKVAIFYAVSCASATACTAVGTSSEGSSNFLATAERWNGTTWSKETTTPLEGIYSSTLTSVSCSAATCIASGAYSKENGGPERTLAYEY